MAGETPTAKPEVDPADYDLGETGRDFTQANGLPPEKPSRERAADGTFLPAGSQPKPPQTPKHDHPGYLVEFAKDFGFTDEEIASTPTETLGRNVAILRKRDEARQKQIMSEFAVSNVRPAQPPAPPPPPEPEPEINLGIDESQYSPEMVALVKKIGVDGMKENRRLRAELEQVKTQQAQIQQTATANHLDSAFDLVDGFDHVYGKGSGTELEQTDPISISRRIETIKAVAHTFQVNPYRLSPKALAAKIQAYSDGIYKSNKPAAPAKPAEHDPYAGAVPTPDGNGHAKRFTEEQWAAAGSAKPTARAGGSEPDPTQKAVEAVAARQREQGTFGEQPNASELDGFLG